MTSQINSLDFEGRDSWEEYDELPVLNLGGEGDSHKVTFTALCIIKGNQKTTKYIYIFYIYVSESPVQFLKYLLCSTKYKVWSGPRHWIFKWGTIVHLKPESQNLCTILTQ